MQIGKELARLFSLAISEGSPEEDPETLQKWLESLSDQQTQQLRTEIDALSKSPDLSVEELGSSANRWFSEPLEAQAWLGSLLEVFASFSAGDDSPVEVKDSNGTLLQEGDSVLVIKDLKVRGGSSDLKRGTIVRKIHLIDDPEVIECRVDGSTLVLKTCFLKKA